MLTISLTLLCSIFITTGKKANKALEIRAHVKEHSFLGIKPCDTRREVCGIFGNGQIVRRSVCLLTVLEATAGGLFVPKDLYSPVAKYSGTCFKIRI
jgi:hypothetical protein